VVVIGGGETGTETGMHLAQQGHKVTVLEMGDMLASKTTPVHYYSMAREAWDNTENLTPVLFARATAIEAEKVLYIDKNGREQSVPAESVVIAVGYQPNNDLAMEFAGIADRFFAIGDCEKVGSIQTVMRSAYGSACML
jgi:pyruvate/2-oxoglutarate dehydrogenase complex dihydrolipoamide dehydrogenase (E3) component